MLAIFNKEFKGYFKSPIGYVFMAYFLVMFGFFFLMLNLLPGNPDYSQVLSNITLIILFGVPLITMRLLTEETKLKTDQLILTSPIKVSGFVVGKFLAAVAVFSLTTLITVLQPLALRTFGSLPVAKIAGGYIGVLLLGTTFIAIGLFLSSLTENQIVAAIATFAVFLFLLCIDCIVQALPKDRNSSVVFACILAILIAGIIYIAIKDVYISGIVGVLGVIGVLAVYFIKREAYDGFIARIFNWFSLMNRYYDFSMGIFDLGSVIYYLSFSTIFVFLTIQMVEKRRWN